MYIDNLSHLLVFQHNVVTFKQINIRIICVQNFINLVPYNIIMRCFADRYLCVVRAKKVHKTY